MAANTFTTNRILSHIKKCGYTGECLKEDYIYYEANEQRQVRAVGFWRGTYNSATACIALIDTERGLGKEQVGIQLLSYRSLGSPVVLTCIDDAMQFWRYCGNEVVLEREVKQNRLESFFESHKEKFSPDSIYRAKTIGRVSSKRNQLQFVDQGLMPAVEKQEGEYLSGLITRINNALYKYRNKPQMTEGMGRWLFQAGFWLLGAKILKDKGVEKFTRLRLSNVESLVGKVQKHYGAADQLDISKAIQKKALERVAEEIVEPVYSLSHLTTESLAYVYENTLVTPKTRKALGTHATPSWLVNYIVWQLADWIAEIPEKDRVILEPACGHAPFLTAGTRLLSFLCKDNEDERHNYLRDHLVGIEKDTFAIEIARLALTLADIPNPDGWNIIHDNIYGEDVLKKWATKSTILLCNPPFENIKADEAHYSEFETGNKAAEVLARTLPYMPDKSVFGVILPQGFLHKKNLADLRKFILDDFEVRTICKLPENVFSQARHPSAVLLGRKKKSKKKINYIAITPNNLNHFIDRYQATEECLEKFIFYKASNYNLWISDLNHIWEYCKAYQRLCDVADIGNGFDFKGKRLPPNSITVSSNPFKSGIKGFFSYSQTIKITELPNKVYMNLSDEVIQRPRRGTTLGIRQILMNYNRVSNGPWRLKAWQDDEGHPVSSNFLVMRLVENCIWTIRSLWALANSPFSNAFAYCNNMERHNASGIMLSMPVPQVTSHDIERLNALVSEYFSLSKQQGRFMSGEEDALKQKRKECLLKIDAEVLRLYDLPPRLEKQLLDFFAGYQRKGVDFEFDRYYPEGFGSYIPLRMFISEEFQNATVENVKQWVDETRSPAIIRAFENASKDFDGE